MKTTLCVALTAALCSSAWAQEPNAAPQEGRGKCRKDRREGSC